METKQKDIDHSATILTELCFLLRNLKEAYFVDLSNRLKIKISVT